METLRSTLPPAVPTSVNIVNFVAARERSRNSKETACRRRNTLNHARRRHHCLRRRRRRRTRSESSANISWDFSVFACLIALPLLNFI